MEKKVPVDLRPALAHFVEEMELKLRKKDHKTSWRELPVEALIKLFDIERQEFEVAHEFLTVAEARSELVDLANYAMIISDRLSLEPQNRRYENLWGRK